MTHLAYLKLGAIVLVLGICAAFAYKVNSWRQDALETRALRSQLVDLKAAQEASHKASEQYQNELEAIRKRPVNNKPVRLCRSPDVPAAASGSGAASAPSRVVSGPDGTDPEVRGGPDIGPALRSLARRADEVSAQGRSTQSLHE